MINPCHGEVKTSCYALNIIAPIKNTTNKLTPYFKVYADMNPNLLSGHNHQIILDKFEARENFNH